MRRSAVVLAIVLAALGALLYQMPNRLLEALMFFPSRERGADPTHLGLKWQDVTFATDDGETLHAWWVSAREQPSAAHVLFFHGNGGNIQHRLDNVDALTAQGLDVFLFDYRGYGRSTGRPTEEGTYRDARAARAALLRVPGVDPRRIVYFGESLGAAVAVELATAEPPAALGLQSPFAEVRSLARTHYPFIPAFIVPDAYPSERRMAQVGVPTLVIHGDHDSIIPHEHGQRLARTAGGPRELRTVKGADHNDLVWVMGREYGAFIAGWIKRTLAGPGPGPAAAR